MSRMQGIDWLARAIRRAHQGGRSRPRTPHLCRLRLELLEDRHLLAASVISASPLANSHTAPPDTNVSVTFDAPISAPSVTDQTFVVHGTQSGQLLTANGDIASLMASGAQITLDPAAGFFAGEKVQVSATAGIQDAAEMAIEPHVWEFRTTTASAPGTLHLKQTLPNFGNAVSAGDIDGDGDLDIMAGGALWMNDGTGGFVAGELGAPVGFATGTTLGDVDGDGDLDLISWNTNQATRLFLNQGGQQGGTAGAFVEAQTLGGIDLHIGNYRHSVALGDLDGDGDLDAFVVNGLNDIPSVDPSHHVWINQGGIQGGTKGTFVDTYTKSGGLTDLGVTLGDLDGDGDLDAFVISAYANPTVSRVWLNNGAGLFTPGQSLLVPGSKTAFGDLDGDGDLDIFIAGGPYGGGSGQPNRVLFNQGGAQGGTAGTFVDSGQLIGDTGANDVALGDFDGDGDLDSLTAGDGPERLWINDGTGVFAESGQLLGDERDGGVAVGDFDGDQDLDAVIASGEQGYLWVNASASDLSATLSSSPVVATEGDDLTYTIVVTNNGPNVADGMRVKDVFPNTIANVSWTAVLSGSGSANLFGSGNIDEVVDLDVGSSITYTVIATIVDPLASNQSTLRTIDNFIQVLPKIGGYDFDLANNGAGESDLVNLAASESNGEFAASDQTISSASSYSVALGDVDGDGDLDAFVANYNQPSRIWFNEGNGTFVDGGQALATGRSRDVALGDLDADGDLDAIIANFGEPTRVWYNQGGAQGGVAGLFVSGPVLATANSTSVALGDLDGDGDLDAFVTNFNQADRVWLNNGDGTFSAGPSLGNYASSSVALGDVDGDGDLDVMVVGTFSPANRLWLNRGGLQGGVVGTFIDSGQSLGTSNSTGVALGDVDADGDLDAFIANFGQPNRLWLNDGLGVFSNSGQSLGNHDARSASLADLDGDGDLDAFVANYLQPDRVWLNQGGAQGGVAGNFVDSGQELGNSNSAAVSIGDLDADGDLDAFVANIGEASRVWINQNFAPPDLLGDYNGDGRVDAGDYVRWRNTLGQMVATPYDGADGNGNRMIDAGDYAVWKENYGNPQGSGGLTAGASSGLIQSGATSESSAAPTSPAAVDEVPTLWSVDAGRSSTGVRPPVKTAAATTQDDDLLLVLELAWSDTPIDSSTDDLAVVRAETETPDRELSFAEHGLAADEVFAALGNRL